MEPLHGLLDMLVLRTLQRGPLHGYGIAKAIADRSTATLTIEFGSLYPALKRLEMKGWIESKWERSDLNRRAKYYRLTGPGRKRLEQEHSEWRSFSAAIARVMRPEPGVSHDRLEEIDSVDSVGSSFGRARHARRVGVSRSDGRSGRVRKPDAGG